MDEEADEADVQTTPTSSADDTANPPPAPERKTNYQQYVVTEVVSCVTFWAQSVEMGQCALYRVMVASWLHMAYLLHVHRLFVACL